MLVLDVGFIVCGVSLTIHYVCVAFFKFLVNTSGKRRLVISVVVLYFMIQCFLNGYYHLINETLVFYFAYLFACQVVC